MKLDDSHRRAWFIGLFVGLTTYLFARSVYFRDLPETLIDSFVFILWAALALVPIFQEISFFGVSLKGEIKELKTEVKSDLADIRNQVNAVMQMTSTINPSFTVNTYPTREEKSLRQLR